MRRAETEIHSSLEYKKKINRSKEAHLGEKGSIFCLVGLQLGYFRADHKG